MGSEESQATFNKIEIQSCLRQAKARIAIHRGKLMNTIHTKTAAIKTDLESGNEAMALIHVLFESVTSIG
jgi:molybdopterin-binding protein